MSPLAAWRDGARRVNRAPAILLGRLGADAAGQRAAGAGAARRCWRSISAPASPPTRAASGVNYDWMQEFSDQATGLGTTFKPTIIGFGAVLDNLSAFLDDTPRPVVIVGAAAVYIVLWIFVAGGIIDRYARDRADARARILRRRGRVLLPVPAAGASCSGSSTRVLFGALHPWLFDTLYPRLTREMTVERTAFAVRVGLYLVFGAAGRGRDDDLRLRQGAGGRRGPAQHARRDRRRRRVHPPQRRRGGRVVPAELRRLRDRAGASTRWSRPAPAAPG